MAFSNTYIYRERYFLDFKILIDALRFIINNIILAFIFLFLTLEEVDWFIYSFRERINDKVIDNTSWNINKIFFLYLNSKSSSI